MTSPRDMRNRPATLSAPTVKLPRAAERAQLVMLVGEGTGRGHALGGDPVVMGRDEAVGIHCPAADISREHARVTRCGGEFVVEDLGSSNGTRVNGAPLTDRRALRYGDRIQLGASTVLIFTRHTELEDQLIQLQKLDSLGVLAGGLAHDFGNVMTIVASNVEYVLEQVSERLAGDDDLVDTLRETCDAAARGLDLVQRLMGFARRKPSETVLFDLREVVADVARLVSRTLPAEVELAIDSSDGEIQVVGERTSVEQMLLNLCLNARDAMPSGGKLQLHTETIELVEGVELARLMVSAGHYAVLSVTDTGHGMDESTRRRVFEPFFTTKGSGGTGLGLAMAYSIARNHGGNIVVSSTPGEGSRFEIYLPAPRHGPDTRDGTDDTMRD